MHCSFQQINKNQLITKILKKNATAALFILLLLYEKVYTDIYLYFLNHHFISLILKYANNSLGYS